MAEPPKLLVVAMSLPHHVVHFDCNLLLLGLQLSFTLWKGERRLSILNCKQQAGQAIQRCQKVATVYLKNTPHRRSGQVWGGVLTQGCGRIALPGAQKAFRDSGSIPELFQGFSEFSLGSSENIPETARMTLGHMSRTLILLLWTDSCSS